MNQIESKSLTAVTIGRDSITRDPFAVHPAEKLLFSGRAGSGKTWAVRTAATRAARNGARITLINLKLSEPWPTGVRLALDVDQARSAIHNVRQEMKDRAARMRESGTAKSSEPLRILIVDEGQHLLRGLAGDRETLQALVEIFSLGGARNVTGWWSTSTPTVTGCTPGVDRLIATNINRHIRLRSGCRGLADVGAFGTDEGVRPVALDALTDADVLASGGVQAATAFASQGAH